MKLRKRITAIMIILMMLFSYMAPVIAASTDTFTVKRSATRGDYEYWLSNKRVNEFTVNGYDDAYCMHAEADFSATSYQYNRAYNMKSENDIKTIKGIDWGSNKITQAKKHVDISKSYKKAESGAPAYLQPVLNVYENDSGDIVYSNYNAVLWILDNMFVPTDDTQKNKQFKKQLFEEAYADAIEYSNFNIDSLNITNSDIQVVQQWALWYFTNSGDSKYHVTALPTVKVKNSAGNIKTINELNQDGRKQKHLNTLYVYFIENAMRNASKYGYSGDRKVKSNYTTKAYLCAVDGKYKTQQPIVKIIREIPFANKYDVVVRKYDSTTKQLINSTMQMSIEDPSGSRTTKSVKGSATIGQYNITDITVKDKIYIEESSAPEGFQKLNGGITLNISKKIYGGTYSLSKVTTTFSSADDKNYVNVSCVTLADIDNYGRSETCSTIYIDIYDKPITASFNLNVKKVDADTGDVIYAPANFNIVKVSSEITSVITSATTQNGIAYFGEQTINEGVTKAGTFTYYIEEASAPIAYQGLGENKQIELSVTVALDNSIGYYVSNASIRIVDQTGTVLDANPQDIKVDVINGKEIMLTVPNNKITGQYYMWLQKVDQDDTSINLNGANFSVTSGVGENAGPAVEGTGFVYNATTAETDVFEITEIQAPDGYIALSKPIQVYVEKEISGSEYVVSKVTTDSPELVEIIVSGNQIYLKIKNKKLEGLYQLQVQKQDSDGNNINGASFMVHYPNNSGVETFTFDDNISNPYQLSKQEIYEKGKDEWIITEIGSPEGYVPLEKEIHISVTKYLDSANNRWDISDIEIKDEDGNDISDVVSLERDDENNLFTIKIVNKKIEGSYSIYYAKEDSLTAERIYSSDTTFDITRNDQESESITLNVGMKIVGPFEIESNGQVDTYVIKEVKEPKGYRKLKDPITVKVHTHEVDGKYIPSWIETDSQYVDTYIGQSGMVYITINNEKITGEYQLDLLKIDADTKEQINGAKFQIKYPGDTEYTEVKFEEGDFLTPPISMTDEGTDYIYIREIETPEGYVELNQELKLEVTKAIQSEQILVQQIKITNADDSAAPEGTEINLKNDNTIEVKVPNKQKEGTYNLEIVKYNEDGSKLSDAEFTVTMPDGTSKTITTDSEGRAQICDVEITAVGVDEFTIKETKAPEGYMPLSEEFKVKVSKIETDNGYQRGDIEIINNNIQNIEYYTRGSQIQICVTNKEMTEYDLSLRKFITLVNNVGPEVSREPVVDTSKLLDGSSTTSTYTHTKEPLLVANTDVVVYTLRMYNEGISSAYVAEVKDDIPFGLEFIVDNEINEKYGWKMYDELGNETTDVEKAKTVKTDYLSKEQSEARQEDNLLKPFEYNKDSELDYRDVQIAFKVSGEETLEDRIIINTAEITKETDENGEDVSDRDSTPNNGKENEDDIDKEYLKLKYFDLALLKWVSSATVIENGKTTETLTGHTGLENPEPVVKVELHRKKLDEVVVKFGYTIKITNEGQIEGYASEISDYIPEGLKFVAEDNPEWSEKDGKIVTRQLENTLLNPGESAEVTVILTWINGEDNLDLKTNIAEISADYNSYEEEDIDSTPNNQVEGEDDIDDAPVLLTIATGRAKVYIILAIAVMVTLASGIVLIKKFVI